MDVASIIVLLQESLFLVLVFCAFLIYGLIRGRQGVIDLILSLYLALLISLKFPYYELFVTNGDATSNALVKIIIFAAFTIGAMFLFAKLIPRDDFETAFQGFGKKIVLALLATVLVMIFSYHALPVTDIITPGSPIQALFGPPENFFWWLLLPLVGLFIL